MQKVLLAVLFITGISIANAQQTVTADFNGRVPTSIVIPKGIGSFQKATIKGGLLNLMNAGGLDYGRFHARLDIIFADLSSPNWKDLDYNLGLMQAAGIKAMLEVDYTPPSLQTPNLCGKSNEPYHTMPSNLQAFGAIAAQLVAHVDAKFPGTVTDYEIWNEPDISTSLCVGNNSSINSYVALYSATAPQMKAQALLDNQSINIGGPVLASPYYNGPSWIPALLSNTTASPYVNFVSYHNYIAGDLSGGWPALYSATENYANAGVLFNIVNKIVSQYKPGTPVYLTEYNSDYTFNPDCCRNDVTYAPLFIGTYYVGLLEPNGVGFLSRATYYSSSNPPFCLFGAVYGDPDCVYPSTGEPVAEPQYYALQMILDSNYLGLNNGGYVAQSSATSPLIAGAFFTAQGDSLLIVNPTSTPYSNVSVIINHPNINANTTSILTINGQPIAQSKALIGHTSTGYSTSINIPAYSVIGIQINK